MDGGPKAYVHVDGAGDALRLSAGFGRLRGGPSLGSSAAPLGIAARVGAIDRKAMQFGWAAAARNLCQSEQN